MVAPFLYPKPSIKSNRTIVSSNKCDISGGNTEKIWAHRLFRKQKANVLKAFKSKHLGLGKQHLL